MLKLVINKESPVQTLYEEPGLVTACYEFLLCEFHLRESVLNMGLDHPVTQILLELTNDKKEKLRGML